MSPTTPQIDRRTLLAIGTAFALPLNAAAAGADTSDPFVGSARAPVTMTLWFDFQCPYCKLLWQGAIPPLNANYIRTGKLKLVFCDYSFLGKDSVTAAVIGRAVWHLFPQAYFAWTTAMFEAQDRENGGFGDLNSVAHLTVAVPGIDRTAFAQGFNANVKRYYAEVRADFDAGTRAGVRGTPAMRIAGQMQSGAVPYEEIAALIDTALHRTR